MSVLEVLEPTKSGVQTCETQGKQESGEMKALGRSKAGKTPLNHLPPTISFTRCTSLKYTHRFAYESLVEQVFPPSVNAFDGTAAEKEEWQHLYTL